MAFLQPGLRSRIFVSLMFMVLVSFILTGLISLYHFEEENEHYHQERLKRKEKAIEDDINYFLKSHQAQQHQDSLSSLFSNKVCELADVHNLDINLFTPDGELIISNNNASFETGRLTKNVPEDILSRIQRGEKRFILPSGDTSDVLLIYSYLQADNGENLAIINIPYFENDRIPDQDVEFLATLLSLYIVLFIAAGVLAYFLSNYITHTLTVIARKMREVQLGKYNEPIIWPSNDEIGRLVEEYNKMMAELEQNAIKLAQSERETAWKEMAKQVAHEIKNPLTPMRLSVQMIERRLQVDDKQKLKEFTESMLTQIDALSNIATAFSRFASLPEMRKEDINLIPFLQRVKAAHEQIELKLPEEDVCIHVDKDQLTRVLNNLILNAEQAIPEGRDPRIKVGFKSLSLGEVEIFVEDNGAGVPADKREKIFEPSFTTKTQGMGLGLAMVKNIVNGFNGEITLESEVGVGSTFKVRLETVLNQ